MDEHIKLHIEGGIATITIDRTASNNALNAPMFRDLIAAVQHCDADDAVKVLIVTGAGKNFSAGGDIKEMASFDFISYDLSILTGQASLALRKCSKPVIAMVNGAAAGAGCGLPHHDGGELSLDGVLECRSAGRHGLYLPSETDRRARKDDRADGTESAHLRQGGTTVGACDAACSRWKTRGGDDELRREAAAPSARRTRNAKEALL